MRCTNGNDSGNYVNGVYTTKNGINNGGLGCPKGTRLYDSKAIMPIFFMPEDRGASEIFKRITPEVAPDILPYYAISNYGRIENIRTGQIMKPNYRPNGYEYYCLAADNCKNGQKKYTTHRVVMKTFYPVENSDELQVNHINGIKSDNYVDKTMPNGSIQSNLEWSTPSENISHAKLNMDCTRGKFNKDDVSKIRELRNQGYTYEYIKTHYFDDVSSKAIQDICLNRTYKDPNYTPITMKNAMELNPALTHRISEHDAIVIRNLYKEGYSAKTIYEKFFNHFSYSSILDVINNISHTE